MELNIGNPRSELVGDFGNVAHQLSSQLEGRKHWLTPKRLRFETSEHNLRIVRAYFPELPAEASPASVPRPGDAIPLEFRLPPRDYQLENFHKFKLLHAAAIFSEPGTGKTKTAIDIICFRYHLKMLTGVLVLSSPKGVHAQWVEEQIPQHIWPNVPVLTAYWNNKVRTNWAAEKKRNPEVLHIFSGNIDMLRSDRGFGVLQTFCAAHAGKLMIVVDESASIKTWSAKRTKRLRQLAAQYGVAQRLIMTGTPIAKDLTDEWSQFYFLDPNIIGHKYKTSFMAQFCIMGGFENRNVVGTKNLEQFKRLTAPYIFRAYKHQLNLPEKLYDHVEFELSIEQRRLIREIKDTMIADLGDEAKEIEKSHGGRISATHAASAILRISQISCGFGVDENGTRIALKENPRIDAMKELLSHLSGKVIIWCRFQQDVVNVALNLPGRYVTIYGRTPEAERIIAKGHFLNDPSVKYLIATPDTAGQGLDGLQTVCENAIYYSNGYNAIARWQSEDRIHRLGMKGAASYYDLVARGSPDRAILRNLRNKKTLSTLVLDDMKELIKEL